MENFFKLRAEKQGHIINAALAVFGKNGYKKASIADIAENAGIAKGMVTYYFGSKKNLYSYLIEECGKTLSEAMTDGYDESVTDFFDNMIMVLDIKVAMMKKHPAIMLFLASAYSETDEEVRGEINAFITSGMEVREKLIFQKTDTSRFRQDVDPKLIDRFFIWAAEGFSHTLKNKNHNQDQNQNQDQDQDEMLNSFVKDVHTLMTVMKQYFYR